MIQFWLVWKYLFSGKKFFNITSFFAVLGIALGVACLVVSMAVVSGFETTLKKSVIDVTGHINLVKRGSTIAKDEKILAQIQSDIPTYKAHTPFVRVEAVVAHNKVISGVLLEGLEVKTVGNVLNLQDRVVEGTFRLEPEAGVASALIGLGVKKRFNLKLGDEFKLILPVPSKTNANVFSPKMKTFRVQGVLSLGKYQFDERVILTDLKTAQSLQSLHDEYSGIKILLNNADVAPNEAALLDKKYGYPYMARHWIESNANLLNAVKNEKWVIFFVVLIMVVAACFNVCSHLFVSVLRRYSDISVLKTLGAGTWFIAWMFTIQGLIMGFIGAFFGIGLGIVFSYFFVWMQKNWEIIPGEVYKLGLIQVELRWQDMAVVLGASMFICFLSTLAPAYRGAKLNPVEGLRYE